MHIYAKKPYFHAVLFFDGTIFGRESTAKLGGRDNATEPKSTAITVEAGKSYDLMVAKTLKEGISRIAIEK